MGYKIIEQTNRDLPLYVTTVDDNIYSQTKPISIHPNRFIGDRGAIRWSHDMAKKHGWRAFTVTDAIGNMVYQFNKTSGGCTFNRRKGGPQKIIGGPEV